MLWRFPNCFYLEGRAKHGDEERLYLDDAGTEEEMRRRYEEVLVLQTTAMDDVAAEALRLDKTGTQGEWYLSEHDGTILAKEEGGTFEDVAHPEDDADACLIVNFRANHPALARAFQILRAATHG